MHLSNKTPATSLGCPLNAVFHILRRPMPQVARTPRLSQLQFFNLSIISIARRRVTDKSNLSHIDWIARVRPLYLFLTPTPQPNPNPNPIYPKQYKYKIKNKSQKIRKITKHSPRGSYFRNVSISAIRPEVSELKTHKHFTVNAQKAGRGFSQNS
jgi:hypothetical protein